MSNAVEGSWVLIIPAATNSPLTTSTRAATSPTSTQGGAESNGSVVALPPQQHTSSLPDRLMSEAYALYTPPDPMSGEYKLLDTSDDLCEYILEIYEASMMKVKRNALVLQELARLTASSGGGNVKSGEGGEEGTSHHSQSGVSSVLQYDDVDLLTYMSTHMQRAVVLEPKYLKEDERGCNSGGDGVVVSMVAVHVSHGYSWLCERMRRYLKQRVSTGV